MKPSDHYLIPRHMMEAMIRYRDHHIPVGDFLQAVIRNDLSEATGRADETNLWIIPIYVNWFYNEVPSPAWGSKEAYQFWLSVPETSQRLKELP